MPRISALGLLAAFLSAPPALVQAWGGPFTTEVRINVINKAGRDFELVGRGQTSNKKGHKRAGATGFLVAGGTVTASIAQSTATAYAAAQGTSWIGGMFGATALSSAASSSATAILWSAGFTVAGGAMLGGFSAYSLFSLIKTEVLEVGKSNAGSFWFKKGQFVKPFLDPAMIPSAANGARTGHTIVLGGSGWSGVGGWLRLTEVGPDGRYRPRYVSIAYSNYLRDGECKFHAAYGERQDGSDFYDERDELGYPGTEHDGASVSWHLRAEDD